MPQTAPISADEPPPDVSALTSRSAVPENFSDLLTSIRRHLHQHPEVGFQEYETSRLIRTILERHGLEVQGPLAGTGLYVDIEGAYPGPRIGYRADIDALPHVDAKRVPYTSQHAGAAHLCGHDAHTAVGIGVALLVSRLRDHLHGGVRVFFQPNEEGMPSGAPLMIRDGVLDGLSAVYAIHVEPALPLGRFGLKAGPITAAADQFRLRILGTQSGHSARPHHAVDTVWVATQVVNTLYQLAGRVTDARNAAVLTICRFRAGEAFNVIPAEVDLGGTLRCVEAADRDALQAQVERAAHGITALYGARAEIDWQAGAPSVVNDPRLVRHLEATARALFGDGAVHSFSQASMGAEDFAHYLEHVPGVLVRVGTASSPETSRDLHDARFDLDERALPMAAQLMTSALLDHLQDRILG